MKHALAAAVLVAVCALHGVALVRLATRTSLDIDESEFLNAGLKIARGERIYVDFAEHHPPFVFDILARLASRDYVLRARTLMTFFGLIALGIAAFLVWRATGSLLAPAIFIAAPALLRARAFADVRAEPLALALFFLGALLVASRRANLGAIGIALVAVSAVVNPKWPLESIVVGVAFLLIARRPKPMVLATLVTIAALALLTLAVDPRTYFDQVIVASRAMFRLLASTGTATGFLHCPPMLRPQFIVPIAVLVVATRKSFRDPSLVTVAVALLVAAGVEIRFVYPYERLWQQYFIFWSIAAAAMWAFLPQAIGALAERYAPRARLAAPVAAVLATVLAIASSIDALPFAGRDPHTFDDVALAATVGPNDTVFVSPDRHPLGARDASYYWFGFSDYVPAALKIREPFLPPLREEDLPPCRLERGLEPHLRLVGGDRFDSLPIVKGCVERLRARGVLLPTRAPDVFIVRRATMAPLS